MVVDYNNIAKKFANSRKNMKWEEIEYFLSFIQKFLNIDLLDIGCGSGRLLDQLKEKTNIDNFYYLGVDLSKELLKEAKKSYSNKDFINLNMLDLDNINKNFDYIFFIASFHHLESLEDRLNVLKKAYSLLKTNGFIFMTNWALDSDINKSKYEKSKIKQSKNNFGSFDYNIKFGDYYRYYHGFTLKELEYLFKKVGFKIIENRLFNNKKNFISILQKNGD